MLNDREVVAALGQRLQPSAGAELTRRLLRVPAVWNALHQPEALANLISAESLEALRPGDVLTARVRPRRMNEDTLRALVAGADGSTDQSTLERLSDRCQAILWASRLGDPFAWAHNLAEDPLWIDALACAWPDLTDPVACIRTAFASDDQAVQKAVANALLANTTPELGSAVIHQALGPGVGSAISSLRRLGEQGLASALAAGMADQASDPKDLPQAIASADTAGLRGEVETSQRALQQAWDLAQESAAEIADRLGDFAETQEELILGVEARQRALAASATSRRRAALGWLQVRLGKADEALAVLADDPTAFEESVVRAVALLREGEREASTRLLSVLPIDAARLAEIPWIWLERARQLASSVGNLRLVGQLTEEITRRLPDSAEAWVHRARFFNSTGQAGQAADAAALATTLSPALPEAEQALAEALLSAGSPDQALPIWKRLAAADPRHVPALGECALLAGDAPLAKQMAERMQVEPSQALRAAILSARAEAAIGDVETARRRMHEIVTAHPDAAPAWLALAELQAASGDDALAGATLASALQVAAPGPELLMAYAHWLADHGRTTEAAAHAVRAVAGEQAPGDWLRRAGEWLQELGRPDDALPLLRRAADMLPQDAAIQNQLARTYEACGMVGDAYWRLRPLPVDTPGIDHLLAGRLGIILGGPSAEAPAIAWAARHLEAAIAHDVVEPEAHLWYARSQMLTGNPIAAVQHYLAANAKAPAGSPTHRQSALELAEAAAEAGQPTLALHPLESLLSTDPTSRPALDMLARTYAACEMWDKALPLAERACELAPDDALAFRRLASIADAAGAPQLALPAYQKLTTLEPADFEAWVAQAVHAARLERTDLRRAALAQAVVLGRRDPERLLRLSGDLASVGELNLAMLTLRRAHTLNPAEVAPLLALAEIAGLNGSPEQARLAWSKLVAIDPANVEFLLAAGEAEHVAGCIEEAVEVYRRAVLAAPARSSTQLALARELWLAGLGQEAEAQIRSTLAAFPGDPAVLLTAGQILIGRGRPEEALQALEMAARLAPADPQVLLALAECLVNTSRPAELIELLDSPSGDILPAIPQSCLRTLAHLMLGEPTAASRAFEHAVLPLDPGPIDRLWISRAARELGAWDHVLRPDRLPAQSSEALQVEAMQGLARLADAAWLYSFVGAVRHAPPAEWLDIAAWDTWSELEVALSSVPSLAAPLIGLGLRADLYRVANDSEHRAALQEHLADRPGIELAETLGIACLRAGLPTDALAAIRLAPRPASAWIDVLQGMAHAGQGAPALALDCFHAASESAALRPLVAVLRARTYLQLGQEAPGLSEFAQALAAWPDEPAWHAELASAYAETSDALRALPHLQQAVALAPGVQDYHLAYARALVEAGQARDAVEEYQPVIDSMPGVGLIWKEAGAAALEAGVDDLARSWFDHAAVLLPDDPQVWVGAALASHRSGDIRRGTEAIQTAARLAPQDVQVLMAQGEIFAAAGKHDKALQAYQSALGLLDDPLPAQLGRIGVMSRIRRNAEAIEEIERLLVDHPQDERLWLALGLAREGNADLPGALAAAEKALELAPRQPEARVALGRLARKLGQLDRAIDVLTTFGPTGAEGAIELGLAHEARREYGQALEQFQRAISLDPSSAAAHFHAGAVLRSIKDYPQAGRMFERAVELNPKDADALHQLAAVRTLELVHGAIPLQAVL